ncbi:hypothetical protein [Gemmobacter sp.]|uniref:hypothetical protein n=1 Tax=Gemmobacter sp. TaxID=1898957 RepID=UPI002AFF7926|nr:hypothetical protein [Gemmobacter sp.]
MRCRSRLARLALAALLALPGAPAVADVADRARMAALAPSEQLRLRAFGQVLAAGRAGPADTARLRAEMVRQGHYASGLAVVARDLWAAPLLAWDQNINGGVLQDRFWLNGLMFQANPAYVAKAGLVTGAMTGGSLRLAWAEGRIIELRGQTELGWSPRHDLARGDAALAVCSKNHVAGWTFLDICARGQRSWRDLANRSAWQASVGMAQVVAGADSLHEIGLTHIRTGGPDRSTQDQLALSVQSVWNRATTDLSATLGRRVPGEIALDWRVDASLGWFGAGRGWVLGLWHQQAQGGAFLGVPRKDSGSGITLTTRLRQGVDLRLGYAANRSTAAFANYSQITLDLRFQGLRW